ncbi:MAG: FHA domain-containing protein [Oscillospiraceae bacterium]|jgi:hypothetical protein|nr:FHA domain-containing protein [Oscillospiraceae bacterium]
MSFTFENQGANVYLVYKIGNGNELDTTSLGMLTNNKIKGIAPIVYTQMDEDKYIKCNITSKTPAKDFFTGVVNKKRLLGVFSGVAAAVLNAEDYMIDASMFLLDLEHIFVDASSCEPVVICLPVIHSERKQVNLSAFFKNILFSIQCDTKEDTEYFARLISYLNSSSAFSLEEFAKLLAQLNSGTAPLAAQAAPEPVVTQPPVQQHLFQSTAPIMPVSAHTAPVAPPVPQAVAPGQRQVLSQPAPPPAAPPVNQYRPAPPAAPNAPAAPVGNGLEPGEKKISMADLLMHYSGEKQKLYKDQQRRIKAAQAANKGAAAPAAAPNAAPAANFSIPGQETSIARPYTPPIPQNAVPQQAPVYNAPAPAANPVAAAPVSPIPQPSSNPAFQHNIIPQTQPAVMPASAPVQGGYIQQAPQPPQGGRNFGETTVLRPYSGSADTTVLNASPVAQQNLPHMIRLKNNERISLNKTVFFIGRERAQVDYCVADNTDVGRIHAKLLVKDGRCFLVDINSKNHSYIDNQMIPSNVETEVKNGQKIRLASEEFEFRTF